MLCGNVLDNMTNAKIRSKWKKYRGTTILLVLILAVEVFLLIRSCRRDPDGSGPDSGSIAAQSATSSTEATANTAEASSGAYLETPGPESKPEETSVEESVPASESESESKEETGSHAEIGSHVETEAEILARLPEKLQMLYERNPDTHDFVFGYEENHDKDFEIDLSEYENCSEIPLLLQWDKRWGYKEYAGEMFGLSGCGPTCLSMCAIYLTGNSEYSPDYMRQFSIENDYYVDENGSKWLLIMEGPEQFGIEVTEIPVYEDRVIDNLEVGNPIVCIVGPGPFTTTGHFIVLAGVDEDGNIKVNDPNSIARSSRTWRFSEFEDQIEAMWVLR